MLQIFDQAISESSCVINEKIVKFSEGKASMKQMAYKMLIEDQRPNG